MTKYTAEQVEDAAATNGHPLPLRAREMLRAYAALLREREKGVTEEIAQKALVAWCKANRFNSERDRMRVALEAVWPAENSHE
jgi:hypothetical protein